MFHLTRTPESPATTAQARRPNVARRVAAVALLLACTTLPLAAAPVGVHLDHGGVVTHYGTIQSAVDASVAGDTVTIDAGTFVEQVTVTKAITLQGAGSTTIIQAPANASLVASSQNTIHNKKRLPIVDLRTSVPGAGTVTVRNLSIDGDFQGHTQAQDSTNDYWLLGIATFDTNAVIDNVDIQGIAAPLEVGGTYEGMSRHAGILAEGSAALGSPVTVTVQNSTIGTFQKAGILAWGPQLNAVISDNHISGVGILGKSGQNGMQIGSTGNRTNTTAIINGNTIDNLGAPESLVAGTPSFNATGILLYDAGTVEACNNHISISASAGTLPNSLTGIGVDGWLATESSAAANVHDNILSGMSVGVQVVTPRIGAIHQISNNTLSTTDGNPVVFHYDPLGNGDIGGETIANFGTGYAIRVVGENFSSGTITAGDGTGLAANSVRATIAGGATTLYVDTTVANGPASAPLTITLNGTYLLDNFVLDGEYIRFDKVAQTITFSDPGAQKLGTTPTLTATSDSGLAVSFSSSTTGVCTITTDGTLTFVATGTCTIDADQAGNGVYGAAPTVSRSFSVGYGDGDGGFLGAADGITLLGGLGLLALLRRRTAKER